jgi:hypothetical protein
MRDTTIFQNEIAQRLESLLKSYGYDDNATPSWRPFAGFGRRIYSPVVDIAVGPFAIENRRYEDRYDSMVSTFNQLIDSWIFIFKQNWREYVSHENYWRTSTDSCSPSGYEYFNRDNANRNARCFIAIEIENENSRKHLMGSIVNTGALGRVGILIAWKDEVLRAAIRMREYFDFLEQVRKRTFNMSGVIVLSKDQFTDCLNKYI